MKQYTYKKIYNTKVIVIFLILLLQQCTTPYEQKSFNLKKSPYTTWEEIFKNRKEVTLTTIITGKILANKSALINLKLDASKKNKNSEMMVPVFSHLIQHYAKGYFLIGAGLDRSYEKKMYGKFKGLFRKSYLLPGIQNKNENVKAFLTKKRISIKGIFYSHLQFSQYAGLIDLQKIKLHFVHRMESAQFRKCIFYGDHFDTVDSMTLLRFDHAYKFPLVGKAIDIFNDNSIWAIYTPGYSDGHISYLINGKKDIYLIAGGAIPIVENLKTGIGPGSIAQNIKLAQSTLKRLITFLNTYHKIKVVCGYELLQTK